jgi:hypothetical protein
MHFFRKLICKDLRGYAWLTWINLRTFYRPGTLFPGAWVSTCRGVTALQVWRALTRTTHARQHSSPAVDVCRWCGWSCLSLLPEEFGPVVGVLGVPRVQPHNMYFIMRWKISCPTAQAPHPSWWSNLLASSPLQRKDAVFSRLVDGQHFSSTYKVAVARGRGGRRERQW